MVDQFAEPFIFRLKGKEIKRRTALGGTLFFGCIGLTLAYLVFLIY